MRPFHLASCLGSRLNQASGMSCRTTDQSLTRKRRLGYQAASLARQADGSAISCRSPKWRPSDGGGRRAESPLRNKAVALLLTIHHATNHSIPLRGCSGRDDSHDISYRRSGHATDEYGRWIGPWLSQSTPTEPRPIQRTAVVRPTPDFQEERVCVEHCWLCC